MSKPIYVVYRLILATYAIVWLFFTIYDTKDGLRWIIYLTNWNVVLETLFFSISFLVSFYNYYNNVVPLPDNLTFFDKLIWVLFIILVAITPLATLYYWLLLFHPHNAWLPVYINLHIVMPALMLVDLWVCSIPLRIVHVLWAILWYLAYIIFVVIYMYNGGTNPIDDGNYVYAVLDWKQDMKGVIITVVSGLLIVPGCYFLSCFAVYLRKLLMNKICPTSPYEELSAYS